MNNSKSYYEVRGLFWKEQLPQKKLGIKAYFDYKKEKLCSIKKTFSDDEPYKAREAAFLFYQSMIDVLCEALGNPYSDDFDARRDLQLFFQCRSGVRHPNWEHELRRQSVQRNRRVLDM